MKWCLFLTVLVSTPLALLSQQKHDYNWFLASSPSADPAYGMTRIDFNTDPPTASKVWEAGHETDFANASWSDSLGMPLYFTNGCVVLNSDFEVMEGGDSINPGFAHEIFCEDGYPIHQGVLIIGSAVEDGRQYLLHLVLADESLPAIGGLPAAGLLYTSINPGAGGGAGKVEAANVPLVTDTMGYGSLTAVRHANGTGWWAVAPENGTNGYYIVLVDSIGPYVYRKQFIGTVQSQTDWAGQAVFSPDGRFYARAESHNGLEVMSFDRCHGAFYAPRHVDPPLDSGGVLYSVAISPNSRYLYVSSQVVLLQYDLLADDLAASVDTVGVYDGFESWLPASFFGMQLAPDGKIYMTTSNGTNVLHVIQRPDEPGDSCLFQQHAVTLPTYYSFSPPNFPNYRLGPAPEGYCDSVTATVGQHLPPAAPGLAVAPNPASGHFTAALPSAAPGLLTLLSQLGTVAAALPIQAGDRTVRVDLSGLPPGVYFCRVEQRGRAPVTAKVVVH